MTDTAHKEQVWKFIKDINVGMLTTVDNGELRARPMYVVQHDYDDTIWFFTKASSEKAFEVKKQHSVGITFCNHEAGVHVSLSGHARLTKEKSLIDQFWNPHVGAWFDKGNKDDSDVALLEIKIYQGEYWESEGNRDFQLYEIAIANLTDGTPDIGNNQKFG